MVNLGWHLYKLPPIVFTLHPEGASIIYLRAFNSACFQIPSLKSPVAPFPKIYIFKRPKHTSLNSSRLRLSSPRHPSLQVHIHLYPILFLPNKVLHQFLSFILASLTSYHAHAHVRGQAYAHAQHPSHPFPSFPQHL